jgi:hypothetical protein
MTTRTPACEQCAYGYGRDRRCDRTAPGVVHVGSRIRIPKGATIHTMSSVEDRPAGRSYVVTVNHLIGDKPRWPGSGGYWTEASEWEVVDG